MTSSTTPKKAGRTPVVTNDSTDVAGYFNANAWPVNISISALGRTFAVPPGSFVLDQAGRKINDPIFENYLGPMQLSREWSNSPVLINRVAPVTPTEAPANPVSEASSLKRDKFGNVTGAVMRKPEAPRAAGGNVVIGMSVEAARRAGFIRPTLMPNEDAPADTAGTPVNSAVVPQLDYAKDIGHNAAVRLAKTGPAPTAPAVEHVEDTPPAATEAAAALTRSLLQEAPPPPQAVVSGRSAAPELPAPDLGDEPKEHKFVCSLDGRGFDYRSHLKKYAERKYPDRVEEILRPYPAPTTSKAAAQAPAAAGS